MLGFLRSLTNQKVMGDCTQTVSEALKFYDRWMRDPRWSCCPGRRASICFSAKLSRNSVRNLPQKPSLIVIWWGSRRLEGRT
jgi:hypothetical protein